MLSRSVTPAGRRRARWTADVATHGDRRAAWVTRPTPATRLAERMRRERTDAVNAALAGLLGAPTGGRSSRRSRRSRRSPTQLRDRRAMTRVVRAGRTTFAALAVPNYRRYYRRPGGLADRHLDADDRPVVAGAARSRTRAPRSGVIVALQTLPVLLLGPYGGVIADRVDKRRLMIVAAGDDGRAGARRSGC